MRCPEHVVNYRWSVIHRFINKIITIHVNVSNNLHLYIVVPVAFDLNGCNILELVTSQNGLYYNKMGVVFDRFNNSEVINLIVPI